MGSNYLIVNKYEINFELKNEMNCLYYLDGIQIVSIVSICRSDLINYFTRLLVIADGRQRVAFGRTTDKKSSISKALMILLIQF